MIIYARKREKETGSWLEREIQIDEDFFLSYVVKNTLGRRCLSHINFFQNHIRGVNYLLQNFIFFNALQLNDFQIVFNNLNERYKILSIFSSVGRLINKYPYIYLYYSTLFWSYMLLLRSFEFLLLTLLFNFTW